MTNHNFLKKLKYGFIAFLATLFLFCAQAFCFTACASDNSSGTKQESPSYSYTDPEDDVIANASFTKGTAGKEFKDYPISSPSDWSKSSDNSAISSDVDSGVVDLSSDAWTEVAEKLKKDNDLLEVLSYQKDRTNGHIADIKSNFNDYFQNPGLHDSAEDSKVYMLNNYSSNDKYILSGTAQYIQNSSKITIEKGQTAKISVWVYTMNLYGSANPDAVGANIVVTNKINGIDQKNYKISSINTNENWKKFDIYVTADNFYPSTVSVRLGLGYGGGKSTAKTLYTEGTVFFDDLTYEIIENPLEDTTLQSLNSTKLDLISKIDFEENYFTAPKTAYHFDMNVTEYSYNTLSTFTGTRDGYGFFTTSNIKVGDKYNNTQLIFGKDSNSQEISKIEKDGNTFKLNNASASIKLSTSDWSLDRNQFAFVSFTIKNELTMLGDTNISIDVYDKLGSKEVKQTKVITIEKASKDETVCNLLFQNNFSDVDDREFYIVINVGPTDLYTIENVTDVASGNVSISNVNYYIADKPADDVDDKVYSFVSSSASKTIALYAGSQQDASDTDETTKTYTLNTKPSEIGAIVTGPAKLKDYFGVEANHSYISSESTIYDIDTRTNGDTNGNYAGLINTEHLKNYKTELKDSITADILSIDNDNPIQPLMIYNKVEDSYGYIGKNFTVAADDYSKVSMKVRVVGEAKAYIYLVDVSKTTKDVLTFDNFTATTGSAPTKGSVDSNAELKLVIDNSVLNGQEWVEVSFYIATGATSKQLRLEVWNGSRDGNAKSQGFVFFDDIKTEDPNSFEGTTWEGAQEDSSHPLFYVIKDLKKDNSNVESLVSYKRPLTDIEKQFNEEYKGQKEYASYLVEYKENYIWAKTSTMIYAVYNTIDPVEVDPYTLLPETDEEETVTEEGSGCSAKSDPATFWLSFSSIALAVILVLAIIVLFIKNYTRKHRVGPDDNKSHYNVSSRIRSQKQINKKKAEEQKALELEAEQELINEEITQEDDEIEVEPEETTIEEEIDDYVYGEVIEDFTNKDEQPEESQDENESSSTEE